MSPIKPVYPAATACPCCGHKQATTFCKWCGTDKLAVTLAKGVANKLANTNSQVRA
ncbi:hypothetical protein ACMYR3_06065 [Ampullimonas aquatilis]|uniref:hypothetical protein n=1 Tax=Ampullimonas aquatilis TaxID=1341549 RepID=UPI003C770069